jgi:hypothetical protein
VTTWNALALPHIDRLSREELIAAIRVIAADVPADLLRLAGVVAPRREGRRILYRLRSRLAADLLRGVCEG